MTHQDSEQQQEWLLELPETPAFVFDEGALADNLSLMHEIRAASGCRVLYSIKASPFSGLLNRMGGEIDGFSVSSLFEARLARELAGAQHSIHITTPGLLRHEMSELGELCDHVSFNSLSQLERLALQLGGNARIGLRVNPQLSLLQDARYDPCRAHSKLGAPLPQVAQYWRSGRFGASGISGLHLHTNHGSRSFVPLQRTLERLEHHLSPLLRKLDWVNLGGGYLFREAEDLQRLIRIIDRIQSDWQAEVFLEPGKSLVGDSGVLVASVIDLFESEGKTIAVLDTSVSHLPEVFEYQSPPTLMGERADDPCLVTLAGCTCLSGDLFGEYRFPRPLEINDRLAFANVGAYSLIKASRFNGYNLPSIHMLGVDGSLRLMKRYDYDDYRQQWLHDESAETASESRTG